MDDDAHHLPDDLASLPRAERIERWAAVEARFADIEADLFAAQMIAATSPLSQLIALDAERRLHSRRLEELFGEPRALRLLTGTDAAVDPVAGLLVAAIRGSVVRAAALEIELAADA